MLTIVGAVGILRHPTPIVILCIGGEHNQLVSLWHHRSHQCTQDNQLNPPMYNDGNVSKKMEIFLEPEFPKLEEVDVFELCDFEPLSMV